MTAAMAMVVLASAQQPPVKVNVLNVCAPAADEQKELSSALAKVPGKPAFSKDYEVSRGHSTLDPSTPIPGVRQVRGADDIDCIALRQDRGQALSHDSHVAHDENTQLHRPASRGIPRHPARGRFNV